jgi:inner membrane transporter RhtA
MSDAGETAAEVPLQAARHLRLPAPLLVLGSAVSTQSGSAIAKDLFPAVGPTGVVFLRALFGTLMLGIATRPRLHGWTRQQALLAAGLGSALAGLNLTFYEALDRESLGIAVAVQFGGPRLVATFGSRRAVDLVWVGLAGVGIALLAAGAGGHASTPLGLGLSAVAGGWWATYIVLGARVGRVFPDNAALFPARAVAALWLLPVGVVGGGSRLVEGHVLLRASAVGVLASAIPWTLELTALRRVPARVFGVIVALTPAVAALSGFLFLDERLGWQAWLALVLIIAASAGVSIREGPSREPTPVNA